MEKKQQRKKKKKGPPPPPPPIYIPNYKPTLSLTDEGFIASSSTDIKTVEKIQNTYTCTILQVADAMRQNDLLKLLEKVEVLDNETKDYVISEALNYMHMHGRTLSKQMHNKIRCILMQSRFYRIYDPKKDSNTYNDNIQQLEFIHSCFEGLLKMNSPSFMDNYIKQIIFYGTELQFGKDWAKDLPWNMFAFYIQQYAGFVRTSNHKHLYQVGIITENKFQTMVENFKKIFEMTLPNNSIVYEHFQKENTKMAEEMKTYYYELKDLHSLEKLYKTVVCSDTTHYYGYLRKLQACGEYLKSTDQTPNISGELKELLTKCLPMKDMKTFRDKVCHLKSIPVEIQDAEKLNDLSNLIAKIAKQIKLTYKFIQLETAVKIKKLILQSPESIPMPHAIKHELSSFRSAFGTLHESPDRNIQLRKDNVNRLFALMEFHYNVEGGYNYNLLKVSDEQIEAEKQKLLSEWPIDQSDDKTLPNLIETVSNPPLFSDDADEHYRACLEILKTEVERKNDLGVELLLMLILKIADELRNFNLNRKWYTELCATLTVRSLRNDLAHGDLYVDLLEIDRKSTIYDIANILIGELENETARKQKECGKVTQTIPMPELRTNTNSELALIKIKEDLGYQIQKGCITEVQRLVNKMKTEDIEWRNLLETTALNLAAGNDLDNVELFELVFDEIGDHQKWFRDDLGDTMLHVAAEKGNVRILSNILKTKASFYTKHVHVINYNGDTPFHKAAIANQPRTFEILCNSWFSKHIQLFNENAQGAIHCAIVFDHIDVIEVFVKWNYHQPLDSVRAVRNQTCLHLACDYNHKNLIRYFIERESDANTIDKDIDTPLLLGKQFSNAPDVLMIEKYMNPIMEDNKMHSAVKCNAPSKFEEIYSIAPFLIWTTDIEGKTPVDNAILGNNREMLELIFHHVLLDYSEKPYIYKKVISIMCDSELKCLDGPCVRLILNFVLNTLTEKFNDKLACFWGFTLLGQMVKVFEDIYILKTTIIRIMLEKISLFENDDRIIKCVHDVFTWCMFLSDEAYIGLSNILVNYLSKDNFINHYNTLDLISWLVKIGTYEQKSHSKL
ncbi:uncharacterized protein [Atheta coriaria]|uniref:uncharacterized protein n=1 Tax=Dalotia coriaria TaxID=877792 RepID=UPI0031F40513